MDAIEVVFIICQSFFTLRFLFLTLANFVNSQLQFLSILKIAAIIIVTAIIIIVTVTVVIIVVIAFIVFIVIEFLITCPIECWR